MVNQYTAIGRGSVGDSDHWCKRRRNGNRQFFWSHHGYSESGRNGGQRLAGNALLGHGRAEVLLLTLLPAAARVHWGWGTAGSAGPIYGYTAGYDAHGNLMSFSDCVTGDCVTNGCGTNGCVMGTWAMNDDKLNRVSSGTATAGPYGPAQAGMSGLTLGWGYDVFGNRQTQTPSGDPATPAPPAQTLSYTTSNNNRIDNYGSGSYDAAGNVLYDLVNHYLYDAEGRLCAVSNPDRGNEQYLYDAEGRRVAKSTVGSLSCDVTNFTPTESYLLGQIW